MEFKVKPVGTVKVVFGNAGSFEITKPLMAMQLDFEEQLKVAVDDKKSLRILYDYVAALAKPEEKEKFSLALKSEMDQEQFLELITFISGSKKN